MKLVNGLRAVVLLGAIIMAGCASPSFSGRTVVSEENREALTMKSEGSLDFEVTEFQWFGPRTSNFVKVSGKARNNDFNGHHGVRIKVQVFDQNQKLIGNRTAILYPTYLGAGKTGDFELTFPYDGKTPQELRLQCVFTSGG